MMRRIIFSLNAVLIVFWLYGQNGEAPNNANSALLPPGAAMASKASGASVNLFTGMPKVSVPIYSYKSNSGIGISVSLDYNGGGVQVTESPSVTGLSWFLNAGGSITRTVRGMPDDVPVNGYLYTAAPSSDWRSNASKYYNDSIDAQQDIFQFSCPGGAGKFVMGKNGQIILTPISKIRIIPTFQEATAYHQTLKSFRIVTEDGVKYDFEVVDHNTVSIDASSFIPGYIPDLSGNYGKRYGVVWHLNRIISPFNTDTIKINYSGYSDITNLGDASYAYGYPQLVYVNNANGNRKFPIFSSGTGSSTGAKINSIEFPDKTTLSFQYDYSLKPNNTEFALSKIKISDTTFRFGYALEYQPTYTYIKHVGDKDLTVTDSIRLILKSVTPFTKTEKAVGYRFEYNQPYFYKMGYQIEPLRNSKDYWGYYNGAVNTDTLIPRINNYTWGADRNSNGSATANSLSRVYLPTGGWVSYLYDVNQCYPVIKQNNQFSISINNNTQNNITLGQVFNAKHHLQFILDKSVSRNGTPPISGNGTANVYVKSTDGSVTYLSSVISLYDLFYSGLRTWTFNLPNGTYRLETSLTPGTYVSINFPVTVQWENKVTDSTKTSNYSGGIRVRSIERHIGNTLAEGGFEEYRYLTEDGKSSGFLGDIPKYDYPYREVINSSGLITDYTAISSDPVAPVDYTQGSPVGYSRVEVIQNSYYGNLGKEVHEFTDLNDINGAAYTTVFPYTPSDARSWAFGLPKRISLYDSSGNLVKRTINNYQVDTVFYNDNNFKNLKTGHSQTNYSTDPNYPPVTKMKTYIGQEYYPVSGRVSLVSSSDTIYQLNGSYNTSWQQLYYDTNYNVSKIVTSLDRSRGLTKEQRIYYPYNYSIGGAIGKLRDSSILSQIIATESWITGDANPRITSAAITAFRQIENGDIKPDTLFALETNKPVVQATIGVFNPSVLNRNPSLIKPQTKFMNYNAKGNMTEMKSLITGQSSSMLLDYDQQYHVAQISNAQQSDIAYTSFESAGTGNWTVSGTQRVLTDKVTGNKCYNLSNGSISKSGLSGTKQYLVTFWAKTGASVQVNGSTASSPLTVQNNWNFYSLLVANVTSVTISGSGLIDELRLHPKDANMITTAYEPLIGVVSTADANNTITYNEYDNLNRPKLVRDKDYNIARKLEYSDSAMLITTAPIWQGFDKRCSPSVPGQIDSIYRDINPFSDSTGYVKYVNQGYLDCSCPEIVNNPQYKVVNGVCEMGTWVPVSSVKGKDGSSTIWRCTYRYCFSDGSLSSYYEILIFYSPCGLLCL